MNSEAYNLLHDGSLALGRAERAGIRVDLKRAKKNKEALTIKIEALTKELHKSNFYKRWVYSAGGTPRNMNSDTQLGNYLYKVLKLKPTKLNTSKKGSTDEEALESLNVPELNTILKIRKLKNIRDTFLEGFVREAVDGFVHPFYNLNLVVTYRSSSDSPNFQNIPVRSLEAKKYIRKCLYPRRGHQIMELDFKGIEVGVGTCYHKDPTMIKYVTNPKSDMHGDMAKQIFLIDDWDPSHDGHSTLRNGAKNGFVFPQFYGDYYGNNAVSLAKWGRLSSTTRWSKSEGILLPNKVPLGKHMINHSLTSIKLFADHLRGIEDHFWNERFPVYNDWKDKAWRQYQKKGYLEMLTGFKCQGVMDRKMIVNYPIQGTAFHCLLWCLIELDRIMYREGWETKIIGQIHDSLIFDIYPPELSMVIEIAKRITTVDLLKNYPWIIVPLSVEAELCNIDESWYYKKKIKI